MNTRKLIILAFFVSFPSPVLQAGPIFTIDAGPPPGPGGQYGSISYLGPNNYDGTLGAIGEAGIYGHDTPLNSGNPFPGYYLNFYDFDGIGHIQFEGNDAAVFTGVVTDGTLSSTGGTLDFTGFLSEEASAFFGVSPYEEMAGTFILEMEPAEYPGPLGP